MSRLARQRIKLAAQLDTLRAEGYEALYNLDYEGARRRFQKMVELAPDHPAGAQSMAASLWVQQLNESWELKATLYSDKAYTNSKSKPKVERKQIDEFRKWIRRAKQLSEARLKRNDRDVEALYFLGAALRTRGGVCGGSGTEVYVGFAHRLERGESS